MILRYGKKTTLLINTILLLINISNPSHSIQLIVTAIILHLQFNPYLAL